METIRFIVEIDEQDVRDHATPEKVKEQVDSGGKHEVIQALADMFGFSTVVSKVDQGTTEFTINRETIDPQANKIFETVLGKLAVLSDICKKDKEEEKKEE